MKQIIIDFETYSDVDIEKRGLYNYAQSATTEILCMGYKIDNNPTKLIAVTASVNRELMSEIQDIAINQNDLREVIPYGKGVSHWDWKNDREIVATCNFSGNGRSHIIFTDGEKNHREIPGLDWDGHCSFDSSGRFMVTDNKKDTENIENYVWLYDSQTGKTTKLASFDMVDKRFLSGDTRCDLHPRWSNDGKMICVDAVDPKTKTRQIFVVYL